jgi:LAO/AO transport system kinase
LKTVATTGIGVAELAAAIQRFREHPASVPQEKQRNRTEARVRELVAKAFMDLLEQSVLAQGELAALVDRVAARDVDPYTVARQLVDRAVSQVGRK